MSNGHCENCGGETTYVQVGREVMISKDISAGKKFETASYCPKCETRPPRDGRPILMREVKVEDLRSGVVFRSHR